ncbi:MAG: nitrile hydratase subunit beta [Hyphomicrobiales bacterium]|nr:nitrile hydratase subunit beta [Hyphomicrobiales bacterium]
MNGAQDLGGMMGFGPVVPEKNEPAFHGRWEARVLANVIATQAIGWWTGDASRFARESLDPRFYLTRGYYEIWLAALEKILDEKKLVGDDEIAAGKALREPVQKADRIFGAHEVEAALRRGWPSARETDTAPKFAVGERVRARNMHPRTHTRLPRYARGRIGTVEAIRGCHVFPDASAHGTGPDPQWVYCVRFSARELWGEAGDPKSSVTIDAFEPYLEPA